MGQRLVLVWSGPVTHYQPLEKPSQAETDTETEADTRHSAFLAQAVSLGNAYGGTDRQTDVQFG